MSFELRCRIQMCVVFEMRIFFVWAGTYFTITGHEAYVKYGISDFLYLRIWCVTRDVQTTVDVQTLKSRIWASNFLHVEVSKSSTWNIQNPPLPAGNHEPRTSRTGLDTSHSLPNICRCIMASNNKDNTADNSGKTAPSNPYASCKSSTTNKVDGALWCT